MAGFNDNYDDSENNDPKTNIIQTYSEPGVNDEELTTDVDTLMLYIISVWERQTYSSHFSDQCKATKTETFQDICTPFLQIL